LSGHYSNAAKTLTGKGLQNMSDDKAASAIAPYGGGGVRSRAANVLALVRRRISLRSELELISGQISEAVPALTDSERVELITALSAEDTKLDRDVATLREQAQRIQAEEAQSKHVRPMTVPLSRTASRMVQAEAERRAMRGAYLSAEVLVTEAVKHTFG